MRCDPSQFSGGFTHIWDEIWMVLLKIRGYGWWEDDTPDFGVADFPDKAMVWWTEFV